MSPLTKKYFFPLIFALFLILGSFLFPGQANAGMDATTLNDITGYAWSDNIGWISLSCTNTSSCATSQYGVDLDMIASSLSGYGWSDNIGWIDFSTVSANTQTGALLGFAQVVSQIGKSDGWDGKISLSGTNYEVNYNKATGAITGYAWGDQVVGWVNFLAQGPTTSSIKVTRVGSDGLISSAPAGTQGKVDALTASFTNPSLYNNLTVGAHIVYATDVPGYTESVGSCTYAIGDNECDISLSPTTNWTPGNCNGTTCTVSTTVNAGQVMKVAVKYDLSPPTNLTATTGSVCGAKVNLSWTASVAATGYRVYRFTPSESGIYTEITGTSGTTTTTYIDIAAAAATTYSYKVLAFSALSTSTPTSVVSALSSPACVSPNSIKVTRVGSDGLISSAPSGTTAQLDGLGTASSTNPAHYRHVSVGTHDIVVTDKAGYTESVGICTYPPSADEERYPAGECTINLLPASNWISPSCTAGFCTVSKSVTDGTLTKVVVKYDVTLPTTSSIKVTRVGSDGLISSAPAGTQGKVDALTASFTNPSLYNNLTVGAHIVYATDVPGYTESVGSCTYAIGDNECDISLSPTTNWTPGNCNGTTCTVSTTVNAGQVMKVEFKYNVTTSTSSIRISHYGETAFTAPYSFPGNLPSGTYAQLDSTTGTQSTDNPHDYASTPVGSHTIYVKDIPLYTESVGTCSYPEGGTECATNGSSFSTTGISCDGTTCSIPTTTTLGNITKVAVRYTLTATTLPAPTITGPSSGLINVNYTFNAVSNLPNIASRVKQTAAVSDALLAVSTPQLKYGFDWDKDGTVDEWQPLTGYKGIGVSVSSIHSWPAVGIYTFQVKAMDDTGVSSSWTPFAINIGQATTTNTSSIKVSHYGSDLSIWPSPNLPGGFFTQLDSTSVTERTDNPHGYSDTTVGPHTLFVKDIPGYTESFGSCEYLEEGTECNVNGNSFGTSGINCNGATCSIPTTTTSGNTRKIAIMYTLENTACPEGGTFPNCSNGVCPSGYTINSSGSCVRITLTCALPQVANPSSTSCICTNGGTGPTCSTLICTLPQVPNSNGTSCICNNGGTGASCACTAPQVIGEGGFCQCPLGTSGVGCIQPSTPQIVSFIATPNTVNRNSPCNLKLIAQGVDSCTITGNSAVSADANGYISKIISTSPITETTKFTATCSNTKKTATVSRNVTCFLNPSTIEN